MEICFNGKTVQGCFQSVFQAVSELIKLDDREENWENTAADRPSRGETEKGKENELRGSIAADNDAVRNGVVILNGFQIREDAAIKDGDEIFFIKKGVLPPEDQLEDMMASRHTPGVHAKVRNARVAVAGLGGLGSHIAISLARIGVGHLLLVDFDVVEPSNLNRQHYEIGHLGMEKTEALSRQIEGINPYIQVTVKGVQVDAENAVDIFKGWDIVCEAFDRPEAKAMLVNTLLPSAPETKIISSSGMAGYGSSNQIRTVKKMKNLYLCGDLHTGAEPGTGLMAPRVMVCAGHQANMALRLVLGLEES